MSRRARDFVELDRESVTVGVVNVSKFRATAKEWVLEVSILICRVTLVRAWPALGGSVVILFLGRYDH